jgi:hypothetical protein
VSPCFGKEFGSSFTGGFRHSDYALEHYRHVLVSDARMASKANYLKLLASHPTCIATTGLHGSIGRKFGEYVAFFKAIVSERLGYRVPGDLAEGRNYLGFVTPEEYVEQAVRLFRDSDLRRRMTEANHHYYQEYLGPEHQMIRTQEIARGEGLR